MRCSLLLVLILCGLAHADLGEDLSKAPSPFTYQSKKVIPVDFQRVELEYVFDVSAKTARGLSKIEFFSNDEGYPMIDLVPEASKVRLNGKDLGSGALPLVTAPNSAAQVRMVNDKVRPFSNNFLEIEFSLSSAVASVGSGGARLVWAMGDVGAAREFMEQYAPANLEFDQFEMVMRIDLKGASNTHKIYTNGEVVSEGASHWEIAFPKYFTTSSFFFHITDKNLPTESADYSGLQATIPITVYSDSSSLTSSGMSRTKELLKELESTYGAFAHKRVVVYLTSGGGGMEHCGATITSLGALGHELTHSWFARGVMPANGNAGWIDEATASWRDNGYPASQMGLTGSSVNLAAFDEYRRTTPQAAYTSGARLLSAFAAMFSGGLKPVMREIFARKHRQTITTPMFKDLLEELSGKPLTDYFNRYVYGSSNDSLLPSISFETLPEPAMISLHPPPLTREEIERLR